MTTVEPPIYLDHLASTPLDPAVLDAMLPWLSAATAGNPHAAHRAGWRAAEAIEGARAEVAALIGARPGEIVFTSGATEANNLALLGATPGGWPVAVSAVEHRSVLACLPELRRRGHDTALLPVDRRGIVDADRLAHVLAAGPALVSVMAANNEVGSVQPLGDIAALCQRNGALLHVDAVQYLATAVLDVRVLDIALLSLSGHKLYGPPGIGALFLREGLPLTPLLHGGGQQHGRRPGTLPTALCVGLGAACRTARERRAADAARVAALRDRLFHLLAGAIDGLRRNDPGKDALPGCLHVSLPGLDAADLVLGLPDLAISTGAACWEGRGGPSHVLAAMGLAPEEAHGSLRIGLGRFTTEREVERAATLLVRAIRARPAR
ncbi:cysteine desulfurase family protein [Chelatococcus sp. SYSU_G07232]|uniref:Cysteine desulfurase n=1 Tax=Chelatococcus albus TaxID=3047466 RepID=A0ABT7AEL3_9HYPH|nr:cysteine desulfurase family protein [Chelatococcus sp. SYSU_G07232]MDJ1157061.1 cysteine desulfurase family protein [Chelatococcus sp. SYSU_G07232]